MSKLKIPARQRLDEAIKAIGTEQRLLFVLNTDGHALPFVHPDLGVDITAAVLERVKSEK